MRNTQLQSSKMDPSIAINMLRHPMPALPVKKTWADLGCGTGTFTLALASLLQPGSTIHAMDINKSALDKMPDQYEDISIKKWVNNFITDAFQFSELDGILIANALHYVKDKSSFIQKAIQHLNKDGYFLVVEYDMVKANKWVPYPLNFIALKKLFTEAGFTTITRLNETPSVYERSNIYSAIIQNRL